jgi:hypothetical protein
VPPSGLGVGKTDGVSGISRVDRVIGAVLLLVLAALVGLGLADNRGSTHSSLSGSATLPFSPPVTGAPVTTTGPSTTTTTTVPTPIAGPVTAVGDSVLLDAQPQLAADVPGIRVDGVVSRQFEAGIAVVQADRVAGTLGRVLVVELGTNGPITPDDVDAMVEAAAGVTRIVFVTVCVPRPWAVPDNTVLTAGVARHADVAVLADWNALATPHPEWFTADQVHLNPAGATALAALVASRA